MSHNPEDDKQQDDTPESRYSKEDITEHALWPLVDAKWGANWRLESIPGSGFAFPAVGIYVDRILAVEIEASCCFMPRDDEEIVIDMSTEQVVSRDVILHITEPVADRLGALASLAEEQASGDEDLEYFRDEDGNLRTGEMKAMYGAVFRASTQGHWGLRKGFALASLADETIWSTEEEPEWDLELVNDAYVFVHTETDPPEIRDEDIENLIAAATILGVPEVVDYLVQLREATQA